VKDKNAVWLDHRLEFSKSVTRRRAKMSIVYLNKLLSILKQSKRSRAAKNVAKCSYSHENTGVTSLGSVCVPKGWINFDDRSWGLAALV